jgi:hypothetical protein
MLGEKGRNIVVTRSLQTAPPEVVWGMMSQIVPTRQKGMTTNGSSNLITQSPLILFLTAIFLIGFLVCSLSWNSCMLHAVWSKNGDKWLRHFAVPTAYPWARTRRKVYGAGKQAKTVSVQILTFLLTHLSLMISLRQSELYNLRGQRSLL